jgi:tetratricopeptide (TPR) repeat protein
MAAHSGQPTVEDCRAAAARVLASSLFQTSPHLASFLRFIVEAALSGQANRIKGYTIGVQALGRGEDFDPQTDPIVRVEAGRLRRTLEKYYAGEGADDPVVIGLPVGSYTPTFAIREAAPPLAPATEVAATLAASLRRRPAQYAVLATAVAAIGVFGIVHFVVMHPGTHADGTIDRPVGAAPEAKSNYFPRTATGSSDARPRAVGQSVPGLPTLYIRPFQSAGGQPASADGLLLYDRLVAAFARFDEIVVRSAPPSIANNTGVTEPVERANASRYELATTLEDGRDGEIKFSFQLIDLGDGTVAWSRNLTRTGSIGDDIVRELTTALAQPYGAIYAIERRKRATAVNLDPRYACLLDALEAWPKYDIAKERKVRACLEQVTTADPNFADGFAALATVYFREYAFGFDARSGGTPPLDRALAAAQRAVALKPESARAHQALMDVYFFRGELSRAIEAGEKAIALNPYDMYVAGAYGTRLILMGELQKGAEVLARFLENRKAPSSRINFALFLVDYLDGDDKAAAFHANEITNHKFSLGLMARALAAEKAGDRSKAAYELGRLFALNSAWRDDLRGELKKFFPPPAIVDRLAEDLAAIGLDRALAETVPTTTKPFPDDASTKAEWRAGSGMPVVAVEPFVTVGTAMRGLDAEALRQKVRDALARFDEVRVRGEPAPPAGAQPGASRDEAIDYRLAATLDAQQPEAPQLTVRLFDGADDSVVWSKTYRNIDGEKGSAAEEVLLLDLMSALAGPNGIIQPDQRRKRAAGASIDPRYSCILDTYEYWIRYDSALHEGVRSCLERLTASDPNFALGFAYLSYVYVREHYFDRGKRDGDIPAPDRAFNAARRAVELNPNSALAYHSLSAALFAQQNVQQGLAAAEKAVGLNPYNVMMISGLGFRLVRAGEVDRGLALLRQAEPYRAGLSSWYAFTMSVGSYLIGDLATAVKYDIASITDTFSPGFVASALVAAKTGNRARAQHAIERLIALQPDWRDDPRRELAKLFHAPWIVNRLASDLADLGLDRAAPQATGSRAH